MKLGFHGVKVTSDTGFLAYREIDDAFGLTEMTVNELADNRIGKNTQHSLTALLRQSVYGRLAGYEDTNDAERLSVDPAMLHVVGERAGCSVSQFSMPSCRLENSLKSRQPCPLCNFQVTEVLVSRSLFYAILENIKRLRPIPIGSG